MGEDSGGTSGNGGIEGVSAVTINRERVKTAREDIKIDRGVRKLKLPMINGELMGGSLEQKGAFNSIR